MIVSDDEYFTINIVNFYRYLEINEKYEKLYLLFNLLNAFW